MTRKERLKYCQFCLNRQFKPDKGLICKLTGEWGDFNDRCELYEPDDTAIQNQRTFEAERARVAISEDPTFGLDKLGIKNGFAAGIILLVLGLGWLVGGLLYNVLFYYSFILILFGLVALIVSTVNYLKRHRENQKIKEMESIIDNDQ